MDTTLWGQGRSNSTEEIFSPGEVPHGSFQLPTFSTAAKIRVAVTVALFLCSTGTNVAMLRSVTQKFQHKPHLRILLVNLAAADLLVTFVVMPLDAVWNVTVQWYAGDLACRLLMFLKLVAMYACSFVTVVISLDRWAAVLHPLRVSRAKRKSKTMLCVAWALSFVLAIPQISRKMARANASPKSKEVPLRCSRNNIPQIRVRTLKMSAITVLTFVVCWTPYYMLGLWYWFSPEMLTRGQVPPSLSHIFFLFGLFSTCLDPLVYCFCSVRSRPGSGQPKKEPPSLPVASFQASIVSSCPVAEPGGH
ncbi:gonadotropin-releasing hormone receptor isoform 2-T2 [Liasis olivaceus]